MARPEVAVERRLGAPDRNGRCLPGEDRRDGVVERRRLDGLDRGTPTTASLARSCEPDATTGRRSASTPPPPKPGSRRPARSRRARACAGRGSRCRTRLPSATQRNASRGEPLDLGCMPQRRRSVSRMRRFVSLSSTTRTRLPGQIRRRELRVTGRRVGRDDRTEREREAAALAGDAVALRDERAAHQLGDAPADGEAQAGAAVAPSRSTRRPG